MHLLMPLASYQRMISLTDGPVCLPQCFRTSRLGTRDARQSRACSCIRWVALFVILRCSDAASASLDMLKLKGSHDTYPAKPHRVAPGLKALHLEDSGGPGSHAHARRRPLSGAAPGEWPLSAACRSALAPSDTPSNNACRSASTWLRTTPPQRPVRSCATCSSATTR